MSALTISQGHLHQKWARARPRPPISPLVHAAVWFLMCASSASTTSSPTAAPPRLSMAASDWSPPLTQPFVGLGEEVGKSGGQRLSQSELP